MTQRILVIQGHPDSIDQHLCHALAASYAKGAQAAGHTVRHLAVAELDFPILRRQIDWETGTVPEGLQSAQEAIAWAQHIVFFFPLWLGEMPALLKAFLEQVARPGFAFTGGKDGNPFGKKGLTGRSARIVITMGMPAMAYRWYFLAHGLRSLKRNILGFVGIAPIHETLIGMVANMKAADAAKWLQKLERMGAKAQ